MFDMIKLMKQVGEMQAKMQAAQESLAAISVTGESGGGLVRVTMNGRGETTSLTIDPSVLKPDEASLVEDLLLAAIKDAKSKADSAGQAKMSEVTAGLPIPPGMNLPGLKF